MNQPIGFRQLCAGLHQDIDLFADTPSRLAAHCLAFVEMRERAALRAYLIALGEMTNSEVKGLLNREAADLRFNSRDVRSFIDAVLASMP